MKDVAAAVITILLIIYSTYVAMHLQGFRLRKKGRAMPIFNSPYDHGDGRNGQEVTIVAEHEVPNLSPHVKPETQYTVRFPDGVELRVWAEEIEGKP